MGEDFDRDELLEVPRIAEYLRVSDVTVYRWCREGRLPCLKLGNSWRVRRSPLEGFLERGERSATLVGQLRPFYCVPDNALAIAQTPGLLFRLDAAFFRIGGARGARLVKFHGGRTRASIEELRARMKGEGLDVERLEDEGRFRFVENYGRPEDDRVRALRGVYDEEMRGGAACGLPSIGRRTWTSRERSGGRAS